VNDVRSSFKWYQSLFGQPETAPATSRSARLNEGARGWRPGLQAVFYFL
jgi:hypothetical protein